jgi:methyl-accepting chemotaxis protein
MRLTVKAKLAGAFGIVIILSMIAGGVGYMKLSDMVATAENLVARAARMEEAAELEKGVLRQVRAEKNMIISASDADADKFSAEIGKLRVHVIKMKEEITAAASEDGKKLMERFATIYSGMNTIQDQTIKFAKTDKAKAVELSMNEGRKAVTESNEAANTYVVHVKKAMDERLNRRSWRGRARNPCCLPCSLRPSSSQLRRQRGSPSTSAAVFPAPSVWPTRSPPAT